MTETLRQRVQQLPRIYWTPHGMRQVAPVGSADGFVHAADLDALVAALAEGPEPPQPPDLMMALRLSLALRLAKEATNGWASYAKRDIEHREIARLHREIDAISARAEGPEPPSVDPERLQAQCVAISILLADAGIAAMPLPDGVREVIRQRDELRAPAEGCATEPPKEPR